MIKRIYIWAIAAVIIGLFALPAAHAVTRNEIIDKVMEAGKIIQEQGLDKAISLIENKEGRFVWHNSVNYLFLMNLEGKMLAHPFKPGLKKHNNLLEYADSNGTLFFIDFVRVAKSKNGMGWVRYMWPIPGQSEPTKKFTFIYRVPDTDYFIGSGHYVLNPGEYY